MMKSPAFSANRRGIHGSLTNYIEKNLRFFLGIMRKYYKAIIGGAINGRDADTFSQRTYADLPFRN
jgi:hypothetical protein